MKCWLLLVAALLLACQAVFAQTQTIEPGFVVNALKADFVTKCQVDRAALAGLKDEDADSMRIKVQLDCDCGQKALDDAFPAAVLSTRPTLHAFLARMSGAADVCMARALRAQIAVQCSQGIDPFARAGDEPSPARTEARCACVNARVAPVADASFAKAADASSARYAALIAASGADQPEPKAPVPGGFIQETMGRCRAVQAPAR